MVVKKLRAALFAFLWFVVPLEAEEPIAVYLTWIDDPTSTMVIQWMGGASELDYLNGEEWKRADAESQIIVDCRVHRVYLEGLEEDTEYLFKIGKREYRFRTMPKTLSRPVRMVVGGDAYYNGGEVFHRMNRVISYSNPDFVVIGGDIAYTSGKKQLLRGPKWALARWQAFLRSLQRSLSRDGRLIPILPVVGNHDVSKFKKRAGQLELFYEIFTFPEKEKAFRALDFGNYLSLILLDTGHTWSIKGEQERWLDEALKQRESAQYLMAAYHVAAYPSHYQLSGAREENIRKHWVPLFEKYHVPFAFEHHNHTFKRTHPIKEGKIDPEGVTYLGDGSWGVPPRQVKSPKELWYLAKSASINSCYFVTLTEEKCLIEAKDSQGEVIDQIATTSLAPASTAQ